MLGAKSANNELFIPKTFGIATTQKWNRMIEIGVLYFIIFTKQKCIDFFLFLHKLVLFS